MHPQCTHNAPRNLHQGDDEDSKYLYNSDDEGDEGEGPSTDYGMANEMDL